MTGHSFIYLQEGNEQKKAGDAIHQKQGKIKALQGNGRVVGVILRTLPEKTHNQCDGIDDNQPEECAPGCVMAACPHKRQASNKTEDGKCNVGIPGVERSTECVGESVSEQGSNTGTCYPYPWAKSGCEEAENDQAEAQSYVQHVKADHPKQPEILVLRRAIPIVRSREEEQINQVIDNAKDRNAQNHR